MSRWLGRVSRYNFRYFPVYQKRIGGKQSGRGRSEDFVNCGYLPSTYELSGATERVADQGLRKVAGVTAYCRSDHRFPIKNGDRLVYLNDEVNFDGSRSEVEMLRIETSQDPTGRGEYLKLKLREGAYTSKGSVQGISKFVGKFLADSNELAVSLFDGLTKLENCSLFLHYGLYRTIKDITFIRDQRKGRSLYFLVPTQFKADFQSYTEVSEIELKEGEVTIFLIKEGFNQEFRQGLAV